MAVLKLHGSPMSTCTARVLLCLYEKGLDFELACPDLAALAHKQQPYLSLNPFGKIPALEDGDVTLFESRAINRYLENKYKDQGTDLLRSGDPIESTTVDIWMEVEAHQFNLPATKIMHQILVNPTVYGLDPDEKVIKTEVEKLGKVFDVYEARLSEHEYLAGDHFTMADLCHIPCLVYLMKTPKSNVLSSRPRVNEWWKKISSRPAAMKVSALMKFEEIISSACPTAMKKE